MPDRVKPNDLSFSAFGFAIFSPPYCSGDGLNDGFCFTAHSSSASMASERDGNMRWNRYLSTLASRSWSIFMFKGFVFAGFALAAFVFPAFAM